MPLSRISRDLLISSTCDFFNDCNKCTPTPLLGVCSFIKSFTATTLRPLWCYPIPWLCTKTKTISIIFAFFSLKYGSHGTSWYFCIIVFHLLWSAGTTLRSSWAVCRWDVFWETLIEFWSLLLRTFQYLPQRTVKAFQKEPLCPSVDPDSFTFATVLRWSEICEV